VRNITARKDKLFGGMAIELHAKLSAWMIARVWDFRFSVIPIQLSVIPIQVTIEKTIMIMTFIKCLPNVILKALLSPSKFLIVFLVKKILGQNNFLSLSNFLSTPLVFITKYSLGIQTVLKY
jgi:hypothetical protein